MTKANTFVADMMADGEVLPRARVIYLARILCRGDIVSHLLRHGRNVRAGHLPAHMLAVFNATEAALLGRQVTLAPRAGARHEETGVTLEQRVFVWAAGVDAYITAARLAGYRPSRADLRAYHQAGLGFGRTFQVDGSGCESVEQVEDLATRLVQRIMPASVPAGGWVSLMRVANALWFRRGSSISQVEVIRTIEETTPPALLSALRRN